MKPPLTLRPDETAFFREHGFLAIDAITTADEVARLREIFERLFATRAGWERGQQFDLAGTDEANQPVSLPQLLNPAEFAPELRETQFRRNALAIAQQLLGPETEPWFEHAILKPAHHGAATPWHQDEAHRDDPTVNYEQLSIWMPLLEATAENGCMRYIPGSHRGPVLAHHSPGDDPRVMALECCGAFDGAQAVACPLPSGGAAIHHCRTLHSAGPNGSDTSRLAYILAFRGAVTANPERRVFSWNAEKATAAQARAEAWRHQPGRKVATTARGWLARIGRKLRRLKRRSGE
jgi:ectoine hydroxylase-related dioxygenase (phytanoyl-CoA dioxygenase family)